MKDANIVELHGSIHRLLISGCVRVFVVPFYSNKSKRKCLQKKITQLTDPNIS